MKNFSLSIYRISINRRLEKEEKLYLSDYDNGKDLFMQIKEFLETWQYEKIQEDTPTTVRDELEQKISRIAKNADGKFEFHTLGRCLSGVIESGEYGTEENIINSTTGELKYRKKAEDAQMIPFFFMFHIPSDALYGYLVIERIGNIGIFSTLTKAIQSYISPRFEQQLVLKIEPFMIPEVFARNLNIISDAKKVILRGVRNRQLGLSQITENLVDDNDVQMDLVYKAPRNQFLNIRQWLEKLKSTGSKKGGYTFNDIEYADVAFELKIGDSTRTVSIARINGLGTYLDISDCVKRGSNGYPTYDSLQYEAKKLLSYIHDETPF